MVSPPTGEEPGEGSSGSSRDAFGITDGDHDEFDHTGAPRADDHDVLEDDLLSEGLQSQISFKRKQKNPRLTLPRFLQPLPEATDVIPDTATPDRHSGRPRQLREYPSSGGEFAMSAGDGAIPRDPDKEGGPLDWYGGGPRRRVAYDDLTAIDWIYEYSKERQRLRMLHSKSGGLLGQLYQLWDASQIWLVLVATGIASGLLAGTINIASNWLEDLKGGYCHRGPGGGRFYLNRAFCCWGLDELAQCSDWTPWGEAFGIEAKSGKYVVEYLLFVVFSVVFGVSASLLVRDYAPYAKQSGIPEIKTILGGFVIRGFMGTWTLVTKSLGLCLAVASGLWLGKEGPLVHVACCCASILMRSFSSLQDNEARKREVLSAAASAGISVAFGAPLGGVLFSLEQLSYYFPDKTMWQSFVCAMVAAFVLQFVDPFRKGDIILFETTYNHTWHDFELLTFAILGVIGGVYGAIFIKFNMFIARWRKSSRIIEYPVLEVCLASLVTAIANYPNVFMRAQSYELTWLLFADCAELTDDRLGLCDNGHFVNTSLLLMAALLGAVFASYTFGMRIPAGIILPSMAVGALYGRMVGVMAQHVQATFPEWLWFASCDPDVQCITPGTYALIGAASALGGVTRMTVSIVVIMFELTGAVDFVLPIMIAVLLAKWVGDAFSTKGIYESWIHFQGYPYLENRDDADAPDVSASKVMTRVEEMATISAVGHTISSLQEFLVANLFRGFPIVTDHHSNIFLGYISRTELSFALKAAKSEPRSMPPETDVFFSHQPHADPMTTVDLRPWMDQTPITLNSKSTLQLTVDMFMKLGLKYILLTDQGRLKGLLTKKDLWYILNNRRAFEGYEEGNAAAPNEESSEGAGLLGGDRDSIMEQEVDNDPDFAPYENR